METKGFTLAEILITLSIIGIVAILTIPSVIVSSNQQEYKVGLQKAVDTLNKAITMNVALESTQPGDMETPGDLLNYFTSRMSISKIKQLEFGPGKNWAFYTTDGMRFEIANEGTRIDGVTFKASQCSTPQPCLIIVDVNGDKKPNPVSTSDYTVPYQFVLPEQNRVNDLFTIMITDTSAIPFGTVAQKALYETK